MFEIKSDPRLLPEIQQAAENKELAVFICAGLSRFLDCTS